MKIIILGCGLNGIITALALAHYGIESTIIEKKDLTNITCLDPRTTAITYNSQLFLQRIGIWEAVKQHAANINEVYVVDNKSDQMIHFHTQNYHFDNLGCMITNSVFYTSLMQLINNHPLINVISNANCVTVKAFSDYTTIHLDISTNSNQDIQQPNNILPIHCDLLITCDGHNSLVVKKYFNYLIDKDYNQSAIVFNTQHQKPHEGTAVEHFMTNGPFAILPLSNQHISSIVWVEPNDIASLYAQMEHNELSAIVQEKFGQFLGKVEVITTPSIYPLKAKITDNYFYNKIVLLGDTAHLIHPLAGQGLNQTIKDIDCLSNIIYSRISLGLDIDSQILTLYQQKRFPDNYMMYLITDNLNRIFSNSLPLLSQSRKIAFGLLDRSTIMKQFTINYAMGNHLACSQAINVVNYIFKYIKNYRLKQ